MTLTFQERIRAYRSAIEGETVLVPGQEVHDPLPEIRDHVRKKVIGELGGRIFRREVDTEAVGNEIDDLIIDCLNEDFPAQVTGRQRRELLLDIRDELLGHGPIEKFLNDDSVTEVMCNGPDSVYIERNGQIFRTDVTFMDDEHLLRVIERIVSRVNRRIDESSPMVDARLPDGSRVHAIIPPLSLIGPCLTIRKFRDDPMTMEDLLAFGTISAPAAKFLQLAVEGAANILISGGTGSGKTTTLNVLSAAIPNSERIVTIEDAAELRLAQEHVVPLETRADNVEGRGCISIRDLVRTSLRMRPDHIIVGECRGPEALDMLQSMNTGHDGSMTTIHANTPREALSRLETLVLTAGTELPLRAIRDQIAGAVDLIVQVTRLVDGTRRVTAITEVTGMESDVITLQDLFVAKPDTERAERGQRSTVLYGPLRTMGVKPHFAEKLAGNGVMLPGSLFAH